MVYSIEHFTTQLNLYSTIHQKTLGATDEDFDCTPWLNLNVDVCKLVQVSHKWDLKVLDSDMQNQTQSKGLCS